MQTPVLEAFTDNIASMKSKLISLPRNNILYLPVIKLNTTFDSATAKHSSAHFLIAVDTVTENEMDVDATGVSIDGVLMGESPNRAGNRIRLDQGLDTTAISPGRTLDPLLVETQYLIEMDNRLGHIVSRQDASRASVSYVDDDNVASYYLSRGTDSEYVASISDTAAAAGDGSIKGPRGTKLTFKVQSSLELNTSDYLFDTIGTTALSADAVIVGKSGSGKTFKVITSTIRVVGVNTGYRVDIPVKFIKLQ